MGQGRSFLRTNPFGSCIKSKASARSFTLTLPFALLLGSQIGQVGVHRTSQPNSYPGLLRQAQEEGLRPAPCPPGPLGAPGHPPVRSVVSPALFSLPIAVTAVSPALLPCPTGTGGPGRGSTAMGMGQKLPFCAHRPADEQNVAKHKCGRQTG